MTDTKISALADGTAPTTGDLLVIARSGQNYSISWTELVAALTPAVLGAMASTATLDSIATAHATAADVAMNSNKLTGLAAGSTAGDSVRYEQIPTDATLSVTDVTTNNVTTSRHGFAPKAPNDASRYLDGTGSYSHPPSRKERIVTARGLVTESCDLNLCVNFSALGNTGASATLVAPPVYLFAGESITGAIGLCSNAGSGVSLAKFGLFDSSGTLLKVTADFSGSLASNTYLTIAWSGGAYSVVTSGVYYVGFLTIASTTQPTFLRGMYTTNGGTALNGGIKSLAQVASQTDITGNVTFSVAQQCPWIGLYN